MLIFGHGNLEADNLLNSRESFAVVRNSGAEGVELDVRMTVDGAIVVIHDAEFTGSRSVSKTRAAERPSSVLLERRNNQDSVLLSCFENGIMIAHPYASMVDDKS
ncbi:MAG: glycerophosphodiester phosphodiesterase family protein [Acidimicrobiales bacterium]